MRGEMRHEYRKDKWRRRDEARLEDVDEETEEKIMKADKMRGSQ